MVHPAKMDSPAFLGQKAMQACLVFLDSLEGKVRGKILLMRKFN
jgi:hypothetical protein